MSGCPVTPEPLLRQQRTGSVYYGHYLAALAFFLGFTSGAIYLYSRGVLARDQIIDFQASRVEISVAFAMVEAVATGFAPLLGWLLDRFPVRNVMALGALWLSMGFLVLSQVDSAMQLAVAAALFVGPGIGCIGTTANAKLMVDWYDQRRGLALAVAMTGYSIAGVITAPIIVYLLDILGWRSLYLLFGSVCLFVVLPAVALIVKQRPQVPPVDLDPQVPTQTRNRATSPAPRFAAYRRIAKSRSFWAAVLLFGSMAGVFSGLNLHLFLHLTDLGLHAYEAATILSAMSILSIASKPLTGWAIDRWSAVTATRIAVSGCMLAVLAFACSSTYSGLLAAAALFGLAFGSMLPLRAALLSRIFPVEEFGRAYGSMRLATFPFTITCPLLVGLVHDLWGNYTPVFTVFSALFASAILIARWLHPEHA